jgi:hypothetical protein
LAVHSPGCFDVMETRLSPACPARIPAAVGLVLVLVVSLPVVAAGPDALHREISEPEIRQLVRALEPVSIDGDRGVGIRGVVEGTPIAPDRLAILVGDVTATLAELHAREELARLDQTPGVTPGARASAERAAAMLGEHLRERFRTRGGAAALAASLRLVEAHRAALERVLLDQAALAR